MIQGIGFSLPAFFHFAVRGLQSLPLQAVMTWMRFPSPMDRLGVWSVKEA